MSGELLRLIRERRGVSVAGLARRSGVGTDEILAIESGRRVLDSTIGRRLLGAMLMEVSDSPALAGDLADPGLIARQRAMPVGTRLESGFALCRFASQLAGAART
jgi:transcriptional regulator with XRE-family HTH domain